MIMQSTDAIPQVHLIKKHYGSGFLGLNKCDAKTKSFFLLQLKEAVLCNIHSDLRLRRLSNRKKETELLNIIKEFSSLRVFPEVISSIFFLITSFSSDSDIVRDYF